MSTVSDQVKCPQCGYEEADHELDCRSSAEETLCTRCGYRESWEAECDEDGKFLGWKHDTNTGMGSLWYRHIEGVAFACHSLHTAEELAAAELWLREQLNAGTVDEDTAYLTRWNPDAKRVKPVVGTMDYAGTMEQVVAGLGLNAILCSPGKAPRFAVLPSKVAVAGEPSCVIVPVLHYLSADPVDGKYRKGPDGSMPAIEYELAYLALSGSELKEIEKLQGPGSLDGNDIVMSVSYPAFGREFSRASNIPRWTQDPAIEKRVRSIAAEASSELATKCAGRFDIEEFADFRSAFLKSESPVSTAKPLKSGAGAGALMPVSPMKNG